MATVSDIIGEEIVLRRKAVLPDGRYIWESEDGSMECMIVSLEEARTIAHYGFGVTSDPTDRASWLV